MEFGKYGQVPTAFQVRAGRIRRGLCDTCRIEPVQCYHINRRFSGTIHERIPLTIEHRVYSGICLVCRPNQDPNPRPGQLTGIRPHHRSVAHSASHIQTRLVQARKGPIEGEHRRPLLLSRQGAMRELSGAPRNTSEYIESAATTLAGMHIKSDTELDFEYEHPGTGKTFLRAIDKMKENEVSRKNTTKARDTNGEYNKETYRGTHPGQHIVGNRMEFRRLSDFGGIGCSFNAQVPRFRDDRGMHPYTKGNGNIEDKDDGEEEEGNAGPILPQGQPMDELQRVIAKHVAQTPDQVRTFVLPSSGVNVIPRPVLSVPAMDSDKISVVTMDTSLQGDDCTVISTKVRRFKPESLSVIGEEPKEQTLSTNERTNRLHEQPPLQ